jgi:hypothetical protein
MLPDALKTVLLRDIEAAAREVEAYPSDEALWRVTPGITNPGGALARHLAGNLRHFIGHVLGGAPYVRDRDAEFGGRGLTRAAVAAELRDAAPEVGQALERITPSQLALPYPVQVAGHTVSTERFLIHLVAHLGYHLGQMDYHRRMKDPTAKPVGTMAVDALL